MKHIFAVLSLSLLFFSTHALASNECNGTALHPCLVEDAEGGQAGFRSWRTAQMMAAAYENNHDGLDGLWMSGSSQPEAAAWTSLAQNIIRSVGNESVEMWDVDLRQESHGYLNGSAIFLEAENNWANLNKRYVDIIQAEQGWLWSLKALSAVDNVLTSEQFDNKQFAAGRSVVVLSVLSEESLANANNMHYVRFTIADHRRPSDEEVQRFLLWVKRLPDNAWVHFHCRAGKGRTSTFMIMYDMLHNANHVSFTDIVKRQAAVDPFYDVTKISRSHPELTEYYQERLEFLKLFYNYSSATLNGYKGSWIEFKSLKSRARQQASPS